MKNFDLAIVNPTGTGEAFCATILEWHSLGVPVISSLNYGMSDMMRYFKELTINNPKQINKKIIYYLKLDEERKSELKLKKFFNSKLLFFKRKANNTKMASFNYSNKHLNK